MKERPGRPAGRTDRTLLAELDLAAEPGAATRLRARLDCPDARRVDGGPIFRVISPSRRGRRAEGRVTPAAGDRQ